MQLWLHFFSKIYFVRRTQQLLLWVISSIFCVMFLWLNLVENHSRSLQPGSQGPEPLERKISASRQCPAASQQSPHRESLGKNQMEILFTTQEGHKLLLSFHMLRCTDRMSVELNREWLRKHVTLRWFHVCLLAGSHVQICAWRSTRNPTVTVGCETKWNIVPAETDHSEWSFTNPPLLVLLMYLRMNRFWLQMFL